MLKNSKIKELINSTISTFSLEQIDIIDKLVEFSDTTDVSDDNKLVSVIRITPKTLENSKIFKIFADKKYTLRDFIENFDNFERMQEIAVDFTNTLGLTYKILQEIDDNLKEATAEELDLPSDRDIIVITNLRSFEYITHNIRSRQVNFLGKEYIGNELKKILLPFMKDSNMDVTKLVANSLVFDRTFLSVKAENNYSQQKDLYRPDVDLKPMLIKSLTDSDGHYSSRLAIKRILDFRYSSIRNQTNLKDLAERLNALGFDIKPYNITITMNREHTNDVLNNVLNDVTTMRYLAEMILTSKQSTQSLLDKFLENEQSVYLRDFIEALLEVAHANYHDFLIRNYAYDNRAYSIYPAFEFFEEGSKEIEVEDFAVVGDYVVVTTVQD